jgi:hypothetical protein
MPSSKLMSDPLMPILWAAISLLCLLFMQRWIHAHLHGVSLLLTGRPEWAVIFYALVLVPGVLLHEASHWLTATLLGVRTGGMSLTPRRLPDGSLQLGYVEYYKGPGVGAIRESLIGAAPLVAGTVVILLIGHRVFSVTNLADAIRSGDINILTGAMTQLLSIPNVLVWLYLLFAISNAMLPSKSDRHAWPAFLFIMGGVIFLVAVIGQGAILLDNLSRPISVLFGYLGTAFSIAIAVDILCIVIIAFLEWILGRLRGASVIYGRAQNEENTA